jgi:RNA polymerase sigma factor (sigma-70 family)
MTTTQYPDEEIIASLRKGGSAFEDMSMYLFHQYKGFIVKVNQRVHLKDEDIQDAYSDSLVKLIQKLKDGSFKGESKISSYFYSIFSNAAVDVSRKNTSYKNMPTKELTEFDAREKDLMSVFTAKDQAYKIIGLMDSIGAPCKQILLDWGYYGFSMEEIAQRSSLSGAESARSMKYKCLKKLKILIAEKLDSHV